MTPPREVFERLVIVQDGTDAVALQQASLVRMPTLIRTLSALKEKSS